MNAERALTFDCQGDTLVGILSAPTSPAGIGVIVVVGGPQYRAGSHRQFVLLARAIAEQGFPVLRFDVRGMGDSAGTARNFEAVTSDIGAAIDALQAQMPGVRHVVLWGLCDGASAALLYIDTVHDPRVSGLCLLNPWVRSSNSLARARLRHYYLQRIAERAFWAKLLSGRVGLGAWRGLLGNLKERRSRQGATDSRYQSRMARGWTTFEGGVLLLLSGNDLTAKEFVDATRSDPTWARALQSPRLERHDLPEADHTFTAVAWRERVDEVTIGWLKSLQTFGPRTELEGT